MQQKKNLYVTEFEGALYLALRAQVAIDSALQHLFLLQLLIIIIVAALSDVKIEVDDSV